MMELEAVGTFNLRKSIDFSLCIICQSKKGELVKNVKENSLSRFKESFYSRKRFLDSSSQDLFDRLSGYDLNEVESKLKWHRNCYSSFTSTINIKRIEKRFLQHAKESVQDLSTIEENNVQESNEGVNERVLRKTIGAMDINLCIFCQKRKKIHNTQEEKVVLVQTKYVADDICNISLNNRVVSCRLGTADPIAAEIKYHKSCLRKHLYLSVEKPNKCDKISVFDIAFQELLKETDAGFAEGHIFSVQTLCDSYNKILLSMNVANPNYPARLVLRRIMDHYGNKIDTVSQTRKNESTLIFPKVSISVAVQAFRRVCQEKTDEEMIESFSAEGNGEHDQLFTRMVFHVAEKIKNDLRFTEGLNNITEITKEAAIRVVPDSLKLLLNLILNADDKNSLETDNQVINIGQDIVYAHNKRKLTPKHVSIGLAIHQATRSKMLVEQLHAAGHCVSYDTIMRIDTSLANYVLQRYQGNNNVYVPENLHSNKFVHFATDNIDIIEETIDGKGTFHATQIVAFQRGPPKKMDEVVTLKHAKVLQNIPREFTEVQQGPIITNPNVKTPLSIDSAFFSELQNKTSLHLRDLTWLVLRSEKTHQFIPSWTDTNKVLSDKSHQISTIGYTPIIPHPAHETDTLLTVLKRCQDISKSLGQKYTVITCDEALYCKLKQIQWYTSSLEEVIVRLGGFHWVYNFLRVIGQHFTSSGLADMWIETGVYGENTALNIIEGKQYNRCIRAMKLTCDALWRVLFAKIKQWANETNQFPSEYLALIESFDASFAPDLDLISKWNAFEAKTEEILNLLKTYDDHNKSNQLFKFWRTYLDLAGLVLKFIRAEREGDWHLHLEAVAQMIPWFFVYDHTNYARWGMVYLMDMLALPEISDEIYRQFLNGNFVVKGTPKSFNEKSPDQALEHVNRAHKIAGGLIGITRKDSARDRWCVTFNCRSHLSEMGRQLLGLERHDYYEDTMNASCAKDEKDVIKLCEFMTKFGIFDEKNTKLVNIFSGEVPSKEITNDLLTAQSRGIQLAEEFLKSRLIEKHIDFYSPLKKNKSKTFKNLHTLNVHVKKTKKDVTVETQALIRQMFSAVNSGRDVDLQKILQNELREPPPSLFDNNGEMRQTTKAVLANLLQKDEIVLGTLNNEPKLKTATIIDGQALVQAIGKPKGAKNFGDLSDAFIRSVMSSFKQNECVCIHVLFDRYNKASIKSGARSKRSQSATPIEHTISTRETPLPRKWDRFIHSIGNKARLNEFLSKCIAEQALLLTNNNELLTSGGFADPTTVVTNISRNVDELKSDHEEADTRFVLHGIDANLNGYERLIIHSRDTDVLLLMVHFYPQMPSTVWIKFGTSMKPKYIPVHDVAKNMHPNISRAILAFHAITGCDSTSAFSGHTKASSWTTYTTHADLLSDFGHSPELTDIQYGKAETFVIKMYVHKKPTLNHIDNINDLRAALFQHIKELDKLPPTKDALFHHLQRANLQAHCWYTANKPVQNLPQPIDNGWEMQDGCLRPIASSRPPISLKDLELISCNCKTGCRTSRCGCAGRKQKCLKDVCHIGVDCFNQYNYE